MVVRGPKKAPAKKVDSPPPRSPSPVDKENDSQDIAATSQEVKRRKKNKSSKNISFKIYINAVLKQIHPDFGITNNAMSIMNSFVIDMFERIANEASMLKQSQGQKSKTLSSHDINSAVKLVLPGELAKHAMNEAIKALTLYERNRPDNQK